MSGPTIPSGGKLGVTVGKFLPFHLGHSYLIAEAEKGCDHLVVLVGDRPGQPFSGQQRAAWIEQMHPEVDVRVVLDDLPEAPEPWATRTVEVLGRRPDVVFTSERYGADWARLMGARHVLIDLDRDRFPVSGSALRVDLAANWRFLPPPVRATLAARVVTLGVESSGTTTLAQELAQHYRTVWAPEYGRWYWEGRRHLDDAETWDSEEFVVIARAQTQLIDALARRANRLVVADTDGWATHVWHRRYVGDYCEQVLAEARFHRADLYLLTAPDFEFVQDGTRESEHLRNEMHGWFVEQLDANGLRYELVAGTPPDRLASAVALVDELMDAGPIPDGPGPWPDAGLEADAEHGDLE